MKKVILFLLLILKVCLIFGQEQEVEHIDDTISVEYSKNPTHQGFEKYPYQSIQNFHRYRPIEKDRLPVARSGNLGLGTHSLFLNYQDWNNNSIVGAYQPYLFTKEKLNFFRMSRPFTQLSYANGSKEEQLFNVFHSQNLGEGLNISFEYQRMTSSGFYIRQLTNHTQFNATFNLTNRNKRFSSRGYFLINDIEAQENGGVVLSQDESEEENTVLLDINLATAQNQSRTNAVGVSNEYVILQDSNSNLLSISHDLDWNKAYRNYSDDTTGASDFYENYFFDLVNSADSSFTQTVSNKIKLNALNNKVSFGIRYEQLQFYQNSFIDEKFSSNYVVANFADSLFQQEVLVNFEKGFSGFHKDELDVEVVVNFKEWKGIAFQVLAQQTAKRADYLYVNQRSNHFAFQNNFKTSKSSSFKIVTKLNKYKLNLTVGLTQFTDYIYYDSTAVPKQFSSGISSFYALLEKDFLFFKHFNFKNTIRYQTFSEENVIPLPNLFSNHQLYYENSFFKESLLFQIGTELFYIGKYGGYEYSPSLAQFYLNRNSAELGDILQVDFFINMRVNKSFRIFLKMENANANSFSEDTYRIQDYPIPGRTMKIGLSWRMIN